MKKINRKVISLSVKLEILKRFKKGQRSCQISKDFGLSNSTIRTIKMNEAKIKEQAREEGVCTNNTGTGIAIPGNLNNKTNNRSDIMQNMEKKLIAWIQYKYEHNKRINVVQIKEKAKLLFDEMTACGENESQETFSGSKGWFERFKKRHGVYSIKYNGEDDKGDPVLIRSYRVQKIDEKEEPDEENDIDVQMNEKVEENVKEEVEDDEEEEAEVNIQETETEDVKQEILIDNNQSDNEMEIQNDIETPRVLSIEDLSDAFCHFEAALQILVINDPDYTRSSKTCRGLNKLIRCYKKVYKEKRARQLSLHDYLLNTCSHIKNIN